MTLASAARWALYILLAFAAGILIGIPAGIRSGQIQRVEKRVATNGFPLVDFSGADYSTEHRVVPAFARWAKGPLGANMERLYPPSAVTPAHQKELATRVIERAQQRGELNHVIIGCVIHAINRANAFEVSQARRSGESHPHSTTLIGYAQKAEYFGQGAWCFLCLSSTDQRHATLRVVVMSAVPDFGLIHVEQFNTEP
ncbi:MAG TPA: hypothetical protein VFJ58_18445 [Armatimonadota bacterium]|nr:hypothetical protein [Armatimonadota bacterium]